MTEKRNEDNGSITIDLDPDTPAEETSELQPETDTSLKETAPEEAPTAAAAPQTESEHGIGAEAVESADTGSASEDPRPKTPETKPSDSFPQPEPEVLSDEFKPHFKNEARFRTIVNAGLYILLIALGAAILGLVVEVYLRALPCRLETTAAAVICFALVGFLWKTISLEAKAGLAAAGLGVILLIIETVFAQHPLGLFGLPGTVVDPALFCLAAIAALAALWLLRPFIIWVSVALSLLIMYAVLPSIFALLAPQPGDMILGPAFAASWPAVLRPGWVLAQIALPLGALFFLALQARVLFRSKFEKHWGFFFWALALLLMSAIGLTRLERSDQPVFPTYDRLVAQLAPSARPAAEIKQEPTPAAQPEAKPAAAEESPAATKTETAVPEKPVSEKEQPTSVTPADEETPAPEAETEPEAATPPAASEKPDAAPGPPPSETPHQKEILQLQERVRALDDEVKQLRTRMDAQESLIRSLIEVFGRELPPAGPETPEPPTPPDEAPPFPEEAPPAPEQDYT